MQARQPQSLTPSRLFALPPSPAAGRFLAVDLEYPATPKGYQEQDQARTLGACLRACVAKLQRGLHRAPLLLANIGCFQHARPLDLLAICR